MGQVRRVVILSIQIQELKLGPLSQDESGRGSWSSNSVSNLAEALIYCIIIDLVSPSPRWRLVDASGSYLGLLLSGGTLSYFSWAPVGLLEAPIGFLLQLIVLDLGILHQYLSELGDLLGEL